MKDDFGPVPVIAGTAEYGHKQTLNPHKFMTQTFTQEEFKLDVPEKWNVYPSAEPGTLLLQSKLDDASLVITTQLMQIAIDKAEGIAQANIRSRVEAHKTHYPNLQLIDSSIAVHSSGAALEMFYSVVSPEKAVLMYVGFVTPKKILSALLIAPADPVTAADLFKQTLSGFQPRLP